MKPETPEALRAGRELFNAGKHFEAHEVWEVAWRKEEGETRLLLQALILVAAACHKASLHEPRGVQKLLTAAAEKLEALPSEAAGFDLEQLRQDVARAVREGTPSFVLVQRC